MTLKNNWLLRNATVVACDPMQDESRVADVLVEEGVIVAVAPGLDGGSAPVLELDGKILMPGLIDTHRHVWQAPLRGIGADWTAMDYLVAVRSKLAPAFAPEDVYAGNLAGALEALDAGITTLVDYSHVVSSPEHADAAIDGLISSGVRALYAYGFAPPTDLESVFSSYETRLAHAEKLRRERFPSNDGLIRMGVALTEMQVPWAQSRAELMCARSLDVPMTLHCSPWPITVDSEPAQMEREGLIGPDMLFVHCTFSSEDDLKRMANGGASLSATPESELQMGMGFPAHGRATALGLRTTLGCDVVTGNGGDLFTAMRLALQVERGRTNALVGMPTTLSIRACEMLPMVTRNAAAAIGLGDVVGKVAVGMDADLIVLTGEASNLCPMGVSTETIATQAHAGNVETVMIRGELKKYQGALTGHVVAEARRNVRAARQRVLDRAGGLDSILLDRSALREWDIARTSTTQPGPDG